MNKRQMCKKLRQALKHPNLFNVSGGCGIDISLGSSPCMDSSGLWFKFCPFCGKSILSEYSEKNYWTWCEV